MPRVDFTYDKILFLTSFSRFYVTAMAYQLRSKVNNSVPADMSTQLIPNCQVLNPAVRGGSFSLLLKRKRGREVQDLMQASREAPLTNKEPDEFFETLQAVPRGREVCKICISPVH